MTSLAACHEICQFVNSLTLVSLSEERTLPARLYASLQLVNPNTLDFTGNDPVRDTVVQTIAQALMDVPAPEGFDLMSVVDEALRHATAADRLSAMFTAMTYATKSADHLRDVILLLVITSPVHTIRDADRLFGLLCSTGTVHHETGYQIEAAASMFLASSLRTFARLLAEVPDHLAHVVEMSSDSKAIPTVLERILSRMGDGHV